MFVLCCGTTVSSMVRHLCPMYVFLIKCMSLITACFALCIGLTLMSVLHSYMNQLNSTCISFFTVDHLDLQIFSLLQSQSPLLCVTITLQIYTKIKFSQMLNDFQFVTFGDQQWNLSIFLKIQIILNLLDKMASFQKSTFHLSIQRSEFIVGVCGESPLLQIFITH